MSLIQRFTMRNVGTIDRVIRTLPMAVFLYVWANGVVSGPPLIALGILSVMLLVTAITSRCSIYAMFGLNTCRNPNS